ncbi:MAG TPA: MFS transporter, partial [Pirellulaceae bacterium]
MNAPWWRELNRYHWYVLVISALGWLFDTMDQQLFVLARQASIKDVMRAELDLPVTEQRDGRIVARAPTAVEREQRATSYGGYATAIFLTGWATGGLVFGMFGDRWGRVRTMMLTILMYSVCTGLSAISVGWWDYTIYRFLTGMGVGGEFAAGVALVAEVMPASARPYALGLLQALSTVGNMMAALITRFVPPGVEYFRWGEGTDAMPILGWRIVFLIGILPSLLLIFARSRLREPEKWQAVKAGNAQSRSGAAAGGTDASRSLGDLRELLTVPTYRFHALVGVLLALSGVMMLWGAGFFTPELIRNHLGISDPAEQDRYASMG